MRFYDYLVINQENKKLTGTVVAEDENKARAELNNLEFSVISITEISEEKYNQIKEGKEKFGFEAFDKHGKKIKGTIRAASRFEAFKKLKLEYLFNVTSIYSLNATFEQQQAEKIKDLTDLKSQLDHELSTAALKNKETNKTPKKEVTNSYDDIHHQELKTKVGLILSKIKEILDQHEKEILPERLKEIKAIINKLIRIKSSTNLKYIEKTCEELLLAVQNQEIYIKDEKFSRERSKINFESKKLLIELHHKEAKPKGPSALSSSLKKYRLLGNFVDNIQKFFAQPETVKLLLKQKKSINQQIITYLKLYFSASKEDKKEIVQSIKTLLNQKKRLIYQIKKAKKISENDSLKWPQLVKSIFEEISLFTGWLLFFYLTLYFLANYSKTKNLSFLPDYLLQFHNLSLLKYLILVVFSLHVCISVKLNYFPRSAIFSVLALPLSIFISLFLISNF